MYYDAKEKSQQNLAYLLGKLGIKTARGVMWPVSETLSPALVNQMITNAMMNQGSPDRLYLDSETLAALSGTLRKR